MSADTKTQDISFFQGRLKPRAGTPAIEFSGIIEAIGLDVNDYPQVIG